MTKRNYLLATAAAMTLVAADVQQAHAQGTEAFVGGLLGGFIGAHAGSRTQQQRTRVVTRTVTPNPAREANREVQTALNFFGFHVGTPDGALGPRSRAGIAQYQAYLGYPATGHLSEFERQILITSMQRAQYGGAHVHQVTARHPDGVRGLLEAVRDEMTGAPPRYAGYGGQSGGPDHLHDDAVEDFAAAAAPAAEAPPAPAVAAAPMVPTFSLGGGAQQVSLASHCNRVGLVTSANGGYTDINTLADPVFALNEQFCLARSYAIAEGEALAAQIPGATPQQVAEQCAGFAPSLQPHVAALSLQPRAEVNRGVAQFVLASGMAPADLTTTARICLSSGYMTENMTVAIGSALLLHALGETGYGELPAHHLLQGIGASQRRELAFEWFDSSVPQGQVAQSVGFAPGPQARNGLINAALAMMGDGARAPAPVAVPTAAPVASQLPLFNLGNGN